MDELFTAWPFLGSRHMTAMLKAEGLQVNRKLVQRLMHDRFQRERSALFFIATLRCYERQSDRSDERTANTIATPGCPRIPLCAGQVYVRCGGYDRY
ncbi:IS3 family transposase [Bradyrhizobium sp. USDA 10063]